VDALIETKKAKEYDAAVALLERLRGVAMRNADTSTFARQIRHSTCRRRMRMTVPFTSPPVRATRR
jgi:hypothetical protein